MAINRILSSLNNFGLIGDFIEFTLKTIDKNPIIMIVLIFLVFLVIMFNNSIVTRKSAYKKY